MQDRWIWADGEALPFPMSFAWGDDDDEDWGDDWDEEEDSDLDEDWDDEDEDDDDEWEEWEEEFEDDEDDSLGRKRGGRPIWN